MAAKKKRKQKNKQMTLHIGMVIARTALLLTAVILFAALMQGCVVNLNCVELPVRGLPPAFDGIRIVYVSDIHLTSVNSVRKAERLFHELKKLQPDMLLLGGDYTGKDFVTQMVSLARDEEKNARMTDMRDMFFLQLQDIETSLGKFAVAGDADNELENGQISTLRSAAALGGVTLLRNESARVTRNGQSIVVVGIDDWQTGEQDTVSPVAGVHSDDFVIVLCHNPETLPALNNQPAADGGLWIDVALTGHTMGGLFRIGGHELLNPLGENERWSAGWHMENSAKVLVSSGLSGSVLPLRLGTQAQAHLITLRAER